MRNGLLAFLLVTIGISAALIVAVVYIVTGLAGLGK